MRRDNERQLGRHQKDVGTCLASFIFLSTEYSKLPHRFPEVVNSYLLIDMTKQRIIPEGQLVQKDEQESAT